MLEMEGQTLGDWRGAAEVLSRADRIEAGAFLNNEGRMAPTTRTP